MISVTDIQLGEGGGVDRSTIIHANKIKLLHSCGSGNIFSEKTTSVSSFLTGFKT